MANYKILSVVKDMVPRSWQPDCESHFFRKLYSLYYVLPYTEEFYHVAHPLLIDGYEPTSIRRIQNTSLFGRYAIRRMQMILARGSNHNIDVLGYACVPKENQYMVCQHSLDVRHEIIRDQKELTLYSTPKQAITNSTRMLRPVLIVARTMGLTSNTSEIYPEYIIEFVPRKEGDRGWGTKMTRKYHVYDRKVESLLKKTKTSGEHIVPENSVSNVFLRIFELSKIRGLKPRYKEYPPTYGTYGVPALWTPAPRLRGGRHIRSQSLPSRGDFMMRGGRYSHPRGGGEHRFHQRCPSAGYSLHRRPNRY